VRPATAWRHVRQLAGHLDDRVVAVETVAAIGLVVVIVVTVLVQIVMRYVVARPNPWTEELSRFAFIWLSLVGSSLATKRGAHFLFESAVKGLSPNTRSWLAQAVTWVIAAMLVGLLIMGAALAADARVQRSPALGLPMVWVYAAMPVCTASMLLHLFTGRADGKEGEPGWASH
jgi:TRAP-type C4-dicarboxylate transport system permease small subunit